MKLSTVEPAPAEPVLNLLALHSWEYRLLSTASTKGGVISSYEWMVYHKNGLALFVICVNDSAETVLEKAARAREVWEL